MSMLTLLIVGLVMFFVFLVIAGAVAGAGG